MVERDKERDDRALMPFIMFQNNLDLYRRIIESSCLVSQAFLHNATRGKEVVEPPPVPAPPVSVMEEHPAPTAPPPPAPTHNPFAVGMIPATEHVQFASAVIESAMKDAAVPGGQLVDGFTPQDDQHRRIAASG